MRQLSNVLFMMLLCLLSFSEASAQATITGRITSSEGLGIAGVTVSVKGSRNSVQTNADGNFSIQAPAGSTLVVSSIGFVTQEILVPSSGTTLSITLLEFSQKLEDVVVVAYGTQRKKDLTGSVTTVSSKDFVKGAITTPEQLIAGKVSGVSITSNGGAPGAGSTIRIRGGASLNASNDPLIVIDGVPVDNSGISGSPNALSLINPNDIETFNILKDASATALYGSRASNGVILITTKKGTAGKPRFNFNTQLQVATPANKVDVLTPAEFRSYVNAEGNTDQKNLMGQASTDWQDEIYQNGIGTDNNLSVSGTVSKIPYRASLGYLNQNGILRTGNLQRTSLGINLSPKLFNDHLKIDINLKGSLSSSRFANTDAIGAAASFDPSQPVRVSSPRYGGYYEWLDPSSNNGLRALSPRNPVALLEQNNNNSDVQRSIGNIVFDYKFHFLPDLRANLNLGYDISKGEGRVVINDSAASSYKRFKDANDVYHGGVNNPYEQKKQNTLMEFYLGYGKNLSAINSKFDLIAGYAYQDFLTTNYNFPDKTTDGTIVSTPNFAFDKPQYTLLSYFGRLNYSILDRYLLTASIRTDGSSRFHPDNRWGVFPSVALAWRVKDEEFLKGSKSLSELKLRVSYGETGQQDGIGYYDYISYFNLSSNTAQYQLGNTFYNLYRPGGYYVNRKWEQTATYNAGLDYGFINNRIYGSVDVYYKETTDMLNEIDQPAGTNFSNKIVANVGSMENRGVEFSINADPIRRSDINWTIGFNATYNKNKITKLTISDDPNYAGNQFGGISGGTGQTLYIHSVGKQRQSFYVYKQVYDPISGKPIDGLYEDVNRDGLVNDKDLYQYKNPDPSVFLGFSSNVNYKRWNGGFVMRASFENYIYNNVNSNLGTRSAIFGNSYLSNAYSDVLNSNISGTKAGQSLSNYYVQNGSFLRMDNLNLGYNFGSVMNKANLRLNFNVMNVFVVTKYKGLDPEISGGSDNNFYPRPRTFILGANLDF